MRLNIKAFAVATGLLWGLVILLLTVFLAWRESGGEHLSRLGLLYPGYAVTYGGSIIGFLWSFVYGAIGGAFFAWLYNRMAGNRYR
ncbi:MAG TPA: hypothetical protein VNM72_10610 [Blastocatellia bacterium]|nr:hypothetical protein [Blastocatellia bacterium]